MLSDRVIFVTVLRSTHISAQLFTLFAPGVPTFFSKKVKTPLPQLVGNVRRVASGSRHFRRCLVEFADFGPTFRKPGPRRPNILLKTSKELITTAGGRCAMGCFASRHFRPSLAIPAQLVAQKSRQTVRLLLVGLHVAPVGGGTLGVAKRSKSKSHIAQQGRKNDSTRFFCKTKTFFLCESTRRLPTCCHSKCKSHNNSSGHSNQLFSRFFLSLVTFEESKKKRELFAFQPRQPRQELFSQNDQHFVRSRQQIA